MHEVGDERVFGFQGFESHLAALMEGEGWLDTLGLPANLEGEVGCLQVRGTGYPTTLRVPGRWCATQRWVSGLPTSRSRSVISVWPFSALPYRRPPPRSTTLQLAGPRNLVPNLGPARRDPGDGGRVSRLIFFSFIAGLLDSRAERAAFSPICLSAALRVLFGDVTSSDATRFDPGAGSATCGYPPLPGPPEAPQKHPLSVRAAATSHLDTWSSSFPTGADAALDAVQRALSSVTFPDRQQRGDRERASARACDMRRLQ